MFRKTWAILKINAVECTFEYQSTKILLKINLFEKTLYKKRSQLLYIVPIENIEGGFLFYTPVKFRDYYQYAKT